MPRNRPPEAVLAGYFGRDFNSPRGVVVGADGAVWFTDPAHGFEAGFKGLSGLPVQVYRFEPKTGEVRAMITGGQAGMGVVRPWGLAVGHGGETLYVVDALGPDGEG